MDSVGCRVWLEYLCSSPNCRLHLTIRSLSLCPQFNPLIQNVDKIVSTLRVNLLQPNELRDENYDLYDLSVP